ncbi:MAG: UDP-N-acetylmuramoyl-tripeptide--D-alanyl-D-alanine ligase [Acidimicrobiia bacterium]|nr:UDP-N-acetylmuramoyl-tripeptide--D-alanyl-D-alanine ligase [Acidimicrobiia bacterium]
MTAAAPWIVLAAGLAAALRWLRVAQREHYISGSVSRFAGRWLGATAANLVLGAAAVGTAVAVAWWPYACFPAAAGLLAWPLGLGLRGRTARLAWTPRLRRLAAASAVPFAALAVAGFAAGSFTAGAIAASLLVPQAVDLGLVLTAPLERRLSRAFVDRAARRLRSAAPTVVAITGSFGKTSTKEYTRHLLAGSRHVIASPASFNNRLGLARAINEGLDPGVQVLIAEMGTYGPGEIADLCRWIPPEVAVITAVGPVHLERFGSLEAIARAKSEILGGARVAVVNWDDPRVRAAVEGRSGLQVVRCSGESGEAEVSVLAEGGSLVVRVVGEEAGRLAADDVFPMNVACAAGVAYTLGIPVSRIGERLADLPRPQHRGVAGRSPSGVLIIDDTYNSNPAGARAAVERLVAAVPGRTVVVTPGMVELGRLQAEENRSFAAFAAARVSDLIVVGRTNRRALLGGGRGGTARLQAVAHRAEAVAWVGANLGEGDGALYENDLPDHYP